MEQTKDIPGFQNGLNVNMIVTLTSRAFPERWSPLHRLHITQTMNFGQTHPSAIILYLSDRTSDPRGSIRTALRGYLRLSIPTQKRPDSDRISSSRLLRRSPFPRSVLLTYRPLPPSNIAVASLIAVMAVGDRHPFLWRTLAHSARYGANHALPSSLIPHPPA